MTGKLKKIPEWLKNLPEGKYTTKDLGQISGLQKSRVHYIFECLQVPKNYNPKYKNISFLIYDWNPKILESHLKK